GAITNLVINGVTLAGTNRVSNGTLWVKKGYLTGALIVEPGGTLILGPPGPVYMENLSLLNQGSVTWTGASFYIGGSSTTSTITNQGLFELKGDDYASVWYGNRPWFV